MSRLPPMHHVQVEGVQFDQPWSFGTTYYYATVPYEVATTREFKHVFPPWSWKCGAPVALICCLGSTGARVDPASQMHFEACAINASLPDVKVHRDWQGELQVLGSY